MWLIFSLLAMSLLVLRRSTEKKLADKIESTSMAWLQQLFALPFLVLMLPLATVYNPFNLSHKFWLTLLICVVCSSFDLILYFKAIQLGDISIIAPILALGGVSAMVGSYLILGQKPTMFGLIGSAFIITGAFLTSKQKHKSKTAINNTAAVFLVFLVIILRGVNAPIEVFAIRETNPTYWNFISSFFIVPTIISIIYVRSKRNKTRMFSHRLRVNINKHAYLLVFIGITMTLNLFFTYKGKLLSDNASYVTTIKSTGALPMFLIGAWIFKEKVTARQWVGMASILIGLLCFLKV